MTLTTQPLNHQRNRVVGMVRLDSGLATTRLTFRGANQCASPQCILNSSSSHLLFWMFSVAFLPSGGQYRQIAAHIVLAVCAVAFRILKTPAVLSPQSFLWIILAPLFRGLQNAVAAATSAPVAISRLVVELGKRLTGSAFLADFHRVSIRAF